MAMPLITAQQALARFGYGPRASGSTAALADPRAALLAEIAQISAAEINGPDLLPADAALAALSGGVKTPAPAAEMPPPAPAKAAPPPRIAILRQEVTARIERISQAETGLTDRLAAFWANHFAVALRTDLVVEVLVGAYEREAIRPHILGRFEDLLLAATRHPAMLAYLDNARSMGPNSVLGRKRRRGLNENHAREILELHSLGVTGGYTQADVTALARVLTGWTYIRRPRGDTGASLFEFQAERHEPGVQQVLGVSYDESGIEQGERALRDIARAPATAGHIARKLAVHFVSDDPPEALVRRLADTFQRTGGDLRSVTEELLNADEAWQAGPTKLRTPQEFLWSAIRAVEPRTTPARFLAFAGALGQPLWDPPSPAGYKDDVASWMAPQAVLTRAAIATNYAQASTDSTDPRELAAHLLGPSMSVETRTAIEHAEAREQALVLMLMSPEFQRR
jgi:uncharacterized protein (DUF1800 family)